MVTRERVISQALEASAQLRTLSEVDKDHLKNPCLKRILELVLEWKAVGGVPDHLCVEPGAISQARWEDANFSAKLNSIPAYEGLGILRLAWLNGLTRPLIGDILGRAQACEAGASSRNVRMHAQGEAEPRYSL